MSMYQIDKLLITGILMLTFSSCSKKTKWFDNGLSREEVYQIMGEPDNTDTEIICVWYEHNISFLERLKFKKKPWKELIDKYGRNPSIAIFDKSNKSLLRKTWVWEIETPLDDNYTDKELLEEALDLVNKGFNK